MASGGTVQAGFGNRSRIIVSLAGLMMSHAIFSATAPCAADPPPAADAPSSTERPTGTLVGQDIKSSSSPSEIPPPLEMFHGRRIAPTMHFAGAAWLTRDEREEEEHCQELLRNLHLEAGMAVCDMGCGNGLYTLQLAELVGPTGHVWAVDIQPEMLRLLQGRATRQQLDRIHLVLGDVHEPHLPDTTLDLILCVDVYHEFSHPEHMLKAMHKALKPDGKLVLVEFREEDPLVPIKPLHKMSKKQVLKEVLPFGFELADQYDRLPWQHVLFFRRAP